MLSACTTLQHMLFVFCCSYDELEPYIVATMAFVVMATHGDVGIHKTNET